MKTQGYCAATVSIAVFALSLTTLPAQTSRAQESRTRPARQYTIEQFLNTLSINGASFSSDESRILFSSNKTGIWNVYSVASTGGDWTAITSSTSDSTYAVSYFPHDDRILFTRDQGGNELNHLYVRTPQGEEKDLTPGDKLKASFSGWTPDGAAFFVSSNERDARFFDLYRYDSKTYERTLFFRNGGGYFPSTISNDERWVALLKLNTTADTDIYLWDVQKKDVRHLSKHEGNAQYSPAAFDPASKYLYYLTNDGREFTAVQRYALADGRHEDVEKANWDIVSTGFSDKGRYRVSAINEDGRTVIKVVENATGKAVSLPTIPNGGVSGIVIAHSESKMALYLNGDRSPNDLYVLQIGGGSATKLTSSLSPDIDAADLVNSEVVRFKARDGMTIPNILFKPHQATSANKAPALVWVHGGPGGQTTSGYSSVIQYLVNHGYVVLGINNRGSSGYGKTSFRPTTRSTDASRCGTVWTPGSTSRACRTSTPIASASSAAATVDIWCLPHWRFSLRSSTSGWTCSASRTGCARSR
jgi:dipeptidyl aminopeptidase/acylaminoacyl peptidase